MGHKTHPTGFRLGIIKDWNAHWFAGTGREYNALLQEDLRIREAIAVRYRDAGVSRVEIERSAHDVTVNVHTARPGIVIGRGGQRVEELRQVLEKLTSKKARLNVQELRQPELDAYLVARSVADQLERRVAFRRAIRQAVARAMQAGAQGVKIIIGGRLGGAEIARREKAMEGRVPLHTLRADIDYGVAEASTNMGRIGVKVWVYKGDVLPEKEEEAEPEAEEMAPTDSDVSAGQLQETSEPSETSEEPDVSETSEPSETSEEPDVSEASEVEEDAPTKKN